MTNDYLLFRHRVSFYKERSEERVTQARQEFGYHRSSYARLRHQVLRQGLEMLRPRERRRPRMPNQVPPGWRSGWSPSRSVTLAWAPAGSPPS